MNPNPFGFDDPEPAVDAFLLQGFDQLSGKRRHDPENRLAGRSQYRNTGGGFRREAQDVTETANAPSMARGPRLNPIAEIEIECDEATSFPPADVIDRLVGRAMKFLIVNSRNIVTGLAQNPGDPGPEILVELEFQADFSTGNLT